MRMQDPRGRGKKNWEIMGGREKEENFVCAKREPLKGREEGDKGVGGKGAGGSGKAYPPPCPHPHRLPMMRG